MGYLAALPRTVANAWRIHTGNPDAYVPLDENSDAFRATRYAETIRQEVARQLQGKTDGKTASFLYDTGMSMLDNILQVGVGMGLLGAPAMAEAAASGGVSAAVAAGSAAASPVSLGMMGLTTASQKLLEMTDEGVTEYTGNYDDYLEKKRQLAENQLVIDAAGKTRTQIDKEKRAERLSRESARALKLRFQQTEKDIAAIEQRLTEIEAEMGRSETWQDRAAAQKLEDERQEKTETLAHLYEDWEALAEQMTE